MCYWVTVFLWIGCVQRLFGRLMRMTTPAPGSRSKTEWARRLLDRAAAVRPFGISETESIMQFARLGTLICLCDARHATETEADRRQTCRGCGGLALACEGDLLDRTASSGEIRAMIDSLRLAGVRARGIEIPETVRNLQELHDYLDQCRGRKGRKPPRRPNAPVALSRMPTR